MYENKVNTKSKVILQDLENPVTGWRIKLATDIKRNLRYNPTIHLLFKEAKDFFITKAVQLILDRLIVMKFLSDQNIEKNLTQTFLNNFQQISFREAPLATTIYEIGKELFNELYNTYNFPIFSRQKDLDDVRVSYKVLIELLKDFLSEKTKYNFNEFPVEIFGMIYEQLLGKVIVTAQGNSTANYKIVKNTKYNLNIRKVEGIYYTPNYIVNYMVEKTVGEKLNSLTLQGKGFDDLLNIKICDPSCGSGSFLIAAYDALLKWATNYYGQSLNVDTKKDILLSCIFGVDIDSKAVEVAKMSLSLKILENLSPAELEYEKSIFRLTVFTSLDKNIKCGDSLIGTDVYEIDSKFSKEILNQFNPFNWEKEFWIPFHGKKFDVIIGNPPYITYSLGKLQAKNKSADLGYFFKKWKNSCDYKINSFALFFELSTNLINQNAIITFIVPGTILINKSLEKVRKFLIEENLLYSFHKLDYKVFEQAEIGDCAILVLKSKKNNTILTNYAKSPEEIFISKANEIEYSLIKQLDDYRLLNNSIDYKFLIPKHNTIPLGDVCKFYNGIKTGDNKRYISEINTDNRYKPVIRGKDFFRYGKLNPKVFVIFDPELLWSNCDESKLSVKNKIFIRQTADTIIATYDDHGYYSMDTVHIIYESSFSLKVILGILNSKIFNHLYRALVPEKGKVFAEVKIANLKQIRIPSIGTLKTEKDKLEKIVDEILKINQKDPHLQMTDDIQHLETLENTLNKIVYNLFELSLDEIEIVDKYS